jgi:hypothetical protein
MRVWRWARCRLRPSRAQEPRGSAKVRPAAEISRALRLAYASQPDQIIELYRSGLERVVKLLEAGEDGRAGVQAVLLGLPEISPEDMAKLAAAEDLQKGGSSWQGQPRVPAGQTGGGEWTSDGGGSGGAHAEAPATRANPLLEEAVFQGVNPAERAAFVQSNLADAVQGAKALGVPPENILGLSALESTWGQGKFAANKNNNFFNMHYPAPFQSGYKLSDKKTKISTFSSYAASMQSFIKVNGSVVRGKSDPEDFARALQDSGKFGIYPDGTKVPTFIHSTARTIVGIRKLIAGSKI